jgi:hypothetical protein
MKTPWLAFALFSLASGAGAQTYGREVPWDTDEAGSSAILNRGNVREAGALRVRTSRPGCFVAAGFPVIRALIDPADVVESARLLFRPQGYPQWYQVAMRRSGEGFLAVLPKPRPSAQTVQYVVEVSAMGRPRARGQELSAPVVEEASQCQGAPAEMMESAAIAVRVPKGAPSVPPVPPGFMPVGTVAVNDPARRKGPLPIVIAGGFAGALAGLFAIGAEPRATVNAPAEEVNFLDSVPPPNSRMSLRALPNLAVRVRIRTARAIFPGLVRVTLFQSFGNPIGADAPCAVVTAPHSGFTANTVVEFLVAGPLQQAIVCQPADRVRIAVEEDGVPVIRTGSPGPPDVPARYFIDP